MKKIILAAVSAAAVLAACGGGGNSGETKAKITSVKVVGASLADSGSLGYKSTIQSGSTSYRVYSERIAASYGISNFCSAYSSPDNGSTFTANAGCTNYAVAGAAINYYANPSSKLSQLQQLVDAGNAGYSSGDLLIVGEGSANDVATLVGAYVPAYLGASYTQFTALRGSIGLSASAGTRDALQAEGVAYVEKLADQLAASIKTNALDKGALRVAVLNTLDVTKTPQLAAALANYGSTNAAAMQAVIQSWIVAYNARLAANLAPYAGKVAIVDFYTNFNAEMANPAQYGLNDVTGTVCDQIVNAGGTHSPGTVTLGSSTVRAACTDSAASAITPSQGADGTSTWWQHYLFADRFHPTPYGHQLLAQLVGKKLTEAGWL